MVAFPGTVLHVASIFTAVSSAYHDVLKTSKASVDRPTVHHIYQVGINFICIFF